MGSYMPLIGITPWYDHSTNITYIKPGYYEGILEAGGQPVLLTLSTDESVLHDIFKRLDGILLSGGADLDAKYYGECNFPFNGEISPLRDTIEIFFAKKAILENKPLFGICRGMQVMNAALGGTLYQDIHSQIKDNNILKHSQDAPKWYPTHDIIINKGSILNSLLGKERISVNSFHHQAVKDVAPGFIVTSKALDGIIESIEYSGNKFALGVQWHPELMWKEDKLILNIFKGFVDNCANERI